MILGSQDVVLLGGFSIGKTLRKAGSAVKSAASVTVKVATAPAKAVVKAVPIAARMTKNVVVDSAKAVGHGVMEVKRASEKAAKKIVRAVVLKNLRGEDIETDMLLGSDAMVKNSVKAVVIPIATTAVLASAIAAPAAPIVPFIVSPIIDEAYATVKKKMDSGKSLQQAVAEAEAEGPPPFYKTKLGMMVIGGSALFAVVSLSRRGRRKGE